MPPKPTAATETEAAKEVPAATEALPLTFNHIPSPSPNPNPNPTPTPTPTLTPTPSHPYSYPYTSP